MTDKTLVERLRRTHVTRSTFGGVSAGAYHLAPVNPDGPEAADALATLSAENEALQARVDVLEAALRGMCEAYKLICDDAEKPYYASPSSRYAAAMKLLEGSGND